MGSIASLSSTYLQSILGTVLQGAGLTGSTTNTQSSSPAGLPVDNSQLSPFAQMLTTLQQLQQTDPSKYQQVTQQIATNLQSAAQTAQAQGNTAAANQLNQLATDFTTASKTGQMPNIQDLAQAAGANGASGHHHHHHFHASSSDADSSSSSSTSNSTSTSSTNPLGQFLSALQGNGTQSASLNPMEIILNSLSNAGISTSNS